MNAFLYIASIVSLLIIILEAFMLFVDFIYHYAYEEDDLLHKAEGHHPYVIH
jgi:hypothetical protein